MFVRRSCQSSAGMLTKPCAAGCRDKLHLRSDDGEYLYEAAGWAGFAVVDQSKGVTK